MPDQPNPKPARDFQQHLADLEKQGLLVRVLSEYEPPAVPVSLVYAGLGRLPMKTRAFIDVATVELRVQLSETSNEG